jgi:serine/threonine protein kinase
MQLWRYGLPIERLGGRYLLEGSLGSGGMADVCLAWDEQAQREVAIKVIKADELEQRTLNRFLKEAAQVSKWRHPHILRFYGEARLELLDPAQGSVVPYIVMEYAQGGDLAHRLHKGQPYPLPDTLTLFSQLCSAVAYAHAHGLVHRDLKPQNVLFRRLEDGSEQALLSDFGLAIEVSATHHTFARGGTLPYMAPEQLRGTPIPASDIFALGVILYQLCTGRLPFRRSLQDLRLTTPLPRPTLPSQLNSALPDDLDAVILCALADDPQQRYADADQLWNALKAVSGTTYRTSDRATSHPTSTPTTLSAYPDPSSTLLRGQQYTPDTHVISAPSLSDVESDSYASIPLATSVTGSDVRIPRSSIAHSNPVTPMPRTRSNRSITSSSRRSHKLWLLLIPLLILSACSLLYIIVPSPHVSSLSLPAFFSSDPTITITPNSQTLTQNYTLQLTHNPTAANTNQVTSRSVSATATMSQTVAMSGRVQVPATNAKGTLLLFNGSFTAPFTVGAGTSVTGKDGVIVIIDTTVTIPKADVNAVIAGEASTPAHAGNPGVKGNIVALDINGVCCTNNNTISARNTDAFTGGQDAQNYHYPTDSDLSQVANTAHTQLDQTARQQLQSKLAGGEQFAGTPTCQLTSTSDHPAGPQGVDVPQVMVTVNDTCQAEAYNTAQVQQQITAQLQSQAANQLGTGYKLLGAIQMTTMVQADASPNGLPMLNIQANGRWKYTFGATQVAEMRVSIVSKNRTQASELLRRMPGVAGVTIQGGGDQLPSQIARINIMINDG